jgi:hypothetical protein
MKTESRIEFEVWRKKYAFSVKHNLPGGFGMNIHGAFDNWIARTNDYSAKSFCDYVESKGFECKPVTPEQTKES